MRKRVSSRNLEPYPARSPGLRFLDTVVIAAGIIGPLSTIPQILKIYLLKNATGVSAFSWGMWALLDIPWIMYGIMHRDRAIRTTYFMWFLANGVVFVGALLYGDGTL